MPSDFSPTSTTAQPGISPAGAVVEMTVPSTESAAANGRSGNAPYAVSINTYEPAWISLAHVLTAYVPVPPAETMSPPTSSCAASRRAMHSSVPVRRASTSGTATT